MAVTLKTRQQIAKLRDAGRLVAETFAMLREHVVPGVTTADLDRLAEEFIRRHGALPIYKGYGAQRGRGGRVLRPAFPATLCTSVNDVICHGIPSPKQVLRAGDIVGVDVGVLLDGWVGDACYTYAVGQVAPETQRLLETAQRCLELGIAAAQPGAHLGDIGAAIQEYAEAQGFAVVREYTGHGVGRNLHEEPTVLHYGTRGSGMRLKPGMVFTIEPMINMGAPDTRLMEDQWTVRTADGSLSAQYEHTVAITEDGPQILTLL
ncbi:type I methionyl aminopeptidase [Kallotenue papyrolyticum]|uniref:type I methionyl aminopeptidase n=1 Tax=Kallotenue papyrolyticum TaxID=1325125 RepID=UPI0004785DF9|nr:type I methionyl aminopeptidase [Kallotenue papyrolyticum]